jgi:hypothetical protein
MIPVLPGVIINISAYFWTAGASQLGEFALVWYASDGITIVGTSSSVNVSAQPLVSNAWTQGAFNGSPAPSNAFWVQPQVISTGNVGGNVTYISDVNLAWGNYVTNMCPNPSFEVDLTGWAGTRGSETLTQVNIHNNYYDTNQIAVTNVALGDGTTASDDGGLLTTLFGNSALQVSTPGAQQFEGVYGPSTWMPVTTNGSMSCNIFGNTGTLLVQAVNQNTGAVLGAQIITLDGTGWVLAEIINLTFVAGSKYYIQIITYGPAQDLVFLVDAVMYQPEPPVTPYVDGSSFQSYWTGAANESASYQPYQFGIVATCIFTMSGVANVINPGEVFPITNTPVLEFDITLGAPPPTGVMCTVVNPAACMTDFAIWQGGALGTDLDPAMAYSTWNTQGIGEGMGGVYARPYMQVTPSLDMINSTGGYTWKRTGYIALGWQWASAANNSTHILTDVQTEIMPINGYSAVTPRGYQKARQLQVIVKPDRLNYVTNPSFETSTANWSGGAGLVLGLSNNVPDLLDSIYQNINFGAGYNSMSVTVANAGVSGNVQISVPKLIPGRTYMTSLWVQADGACMGDCLVTMATIRL